ncbi:MAG: ribosome maturation factor [Chitinophagaceae bacterium]
MTSVEQIEKLTPLINEVLADTPQFFLVSLKVKPTHNIKLFIDGDTGLTIENCIAVNRKLYPLIEALGMYEPGDFSLEVSSPGIDEPLRLHRQYLKNIGRSLDIVLLDGTEQKGVLTAVTDEVITLQVTTGKGKKAVTNTLELAFAQIKTATVQIIF